MPRFRTSLLSTLVTASLAIAACNGATPDPVVPAKPPRPSATAPSKPVRVMFEIPEEGAPIDMTRTPWPTEMARLPDGHLDLRAYPGHGSTLLEEYLARAAEDLDGFSIAPVVYFRFEGPLDLRAAPAEDTSRSAGAPIVLVDVDPVSPEQGTFYPIALHATTRDMRYVKAGTLAVRPLDGFVLRPGTLYAAVVKRSFGGVPGGLATSPDLDAVVARSPRGGAAAERAHAQHAPSIGALEQLGITRADIAALAVFRTGAPHLPNERLVRAVDDLFAAPTPAAGTGAAPAAKGATAAPGTHMTSAAPAAPRVVSAAWDISYGVPGLYRVVRGWYCTPNFQQHIENAPFLEHEGGRVLLSSGGQPQVAVVPAAARAAHTDCPGQIRARFLLSVPDMPAPKDGFPLLVTAHGTGGSATSFLGRADFAGWAAQEGFAAISTDQPLNGGVESGRPGAAGPVVLPMGITLPGNRFGASIAFYNPLYPGATRGNMHQATADALVLVRLFAGLDFAALRDAKGQPLLRATASEPAPRLDARRTVLAGHSQGCQSLAAVGAVDPRTRGVILSGCGGDARLGILYGRPVDEPISEWISLTLGLDPEELSPFHPLMALVQNLADPIDPLAFARLYREPPPGRTAPKILHFEGLRDRYTPEVAAEALAVALRARPVTPLVRPVTGLVLLGLQAPGSGSPPAPPLPGAAPTDRLFAQFAPARGREGHFVLYDVPGASDLFRDLLRAAAP